MKLMHRKVSMSTSSNTKALLQTLLWRQQGNIGGRLGKLVIYIHNVMRPIQIFASHIITLMWGFLEPKTRTFHLKCHIFVLNRYKNIRWKVEVQSFLSQLMMSNRVRETFEKSLEYLLLSSVPPEILQFSGRETPFSSNLRHHPSLLSLLPQWVGRNKKIKSRFFFL